MALLAVVDSSLAGVIKDLRAIGLLGHAREGLAALESETKSLRNDIEALEAWLSAHPHRRLPTLKKVEELSSRYHLRLRQVERVNSDQDPQRYRTTIHGRISRVVKFLRDLEENYRFETEYVELQPVTEDGGIVSLGMLIRVAKNNAR